VLARSPFVMPNVFPTSNKQLAEPVSLNTFFLLISFEVTLNVVLSLRPRHTVNLSVPDVRSIWPAC